MNSERESEAQGFHVPFLTRIIPSKCIPVILSAAVIFCVKKYNAFFCTQWRAVQRASPMIDCAEWEEDARKSWLTY